MAILLPYIFMSIFDEHLRQQFLTGNLISDLYAELFLKRTNANISVLFLFYVHILEAFFIIPLRILNAFFVGIFMCSFISVSAAIKYLHISLKICFNVFIFVHVSLTFPFFVIFSFFFFSFFFFLGDS